jgi:hypothetical protein
MAASPFLTALRESMMVRRYSRRTIDSYLHWIKALILKQGAHGVRSPLSYLMTKN